MPNQLLPLPASTGMNLDEIKLEISQVAEFGRHGTGIEFDAQGTVRSMVVLLMVFNFLVFASGG